MIATVVTIPAGARGVDYSFARPDPAALRASGFTFAARYISVPPANRAKNLTPAERDTLFAAGLAVLLLWEMSATAANGGYPIGKSHGASAALEAAKLGYPKGLPIIAAWDTDTTSANILTHTAYGYGFADAVEPAGYRLGVYGDVDIIGALHDRSTCNHVAGASSWSHGKIDTDPLVHMRQTISGSTPSWDVNLVRRPVDMWFPHDVPDLPHIDVVVDPPAPQVPTPPVEDDMPAIVTNADAFDHPQWGHREAGTVKWEYVGGCKVHVSEAYWNGLGNPHGLERPYAEIDAVPDAVATAPVVLNVSGTFTGTTK